jgi:ubiquinone/menaquinone biosynthesis C-methylase UbiE
MVTAPDVPPGVTRLPALSGTGHDARMTVGLGEHYGNGPGEASRLWRTAHGRLEFLRTKELLRGVLRSAAEVEPPAVRVPVSAVVPPMFASPASGVMPPVFASAASGVAPPVSVSPAWGVVPPVFASPASVVVPPVSAVVSEASGGLRRAGSVVLDVGGGTGVHAAWLAADGHAVHVVDVVAEHVAVAAQLPGVTAEVGDARALPAADASVDAVLLLGPLYHLTSAADRAAALAEARRVLRPGGVLAAGAISRYLSVVEAGTTGKLTEPMTASIRPTIDDGTYDAHLGFVPAHFHTATELADEVRSAGFRMVEVHGVEGPTWAALDAMEDKFEELAEAALRSARLLSQDPLMINASAHLLALATK